MSSHRDLTEFIVRGHAGRCMQTLSVMCQNLVGLKGAATRIEQLLCGRHCARDMAVNKTNIVEFTLCVLDLKWYL